MNPREINKSQPHVLFPSTLFYQKSYFCLCYFLNWRVLFSTSKVLFGLPLLFLVPSTWINSLSFTSALVTLLWTWPNHVVILIENGSFYQSSNSWHSGNYKRANLLNLSANWHYSSRFAIFFFLISIWFSFFWFLWEKIWDNTTDSTIFEL